MTDSISSVPPVQVFTRNISSSPKGKRKDLPSVNIKQSVMTKRDQKALPSLNSTVQLQTLSKAESQSRSAKKPLKSDEQESWPQQLKRILNRFETTVKEFLDSIYKKVSSVISVLRHCLEAFEDTHFEHEAEVVKLPGDRSPKDLSELFQNDLALKDELGISVIFSSTEKKLRQIFSKVNQGNPPGQGFKPSANLLLSGNDAEGILKSPFVEKLKDRGFKKVDHNQTINLNNVKSLESLKQKLLERFPGEDTRVLYLKHIDLAENHHLGTEEKVKVLQFLSDTLFSPDSEKALKSLGLSLKNALLISSVSQDSFMEQLEKEAVPESERALLERTGKQLFENASQQADGDFMMIRHDKGPDELDPFMEH